MKLGGLAKRMAQKVGGVFARLMPCAISFGNKDKPNH
jgi:hypothetical protein